MAFKPNLKASPIMLGLNFVYETLANVCTMEWAAPHGGSGRQTLPTYTRELVFESDHGFFLEEVE